MLRESADQRQAWALAKMQRLALPKPGEDEEQRDIQWRQAQAEFDAAGSEYAKLAASCCR
jgi:hypothetical protein